MFIQRPATQEEQNLLFRSCGITRPMDVYVNEETGRGFYISKDRKNRLVYTYEKPSSPSPAQFSQNLPDEAN